MYDLSKPQKSIYNMEKFTGGTVANICCSMLCVGKMDIDTLKNAVNELYRLNDALRVRIMETPSGTRQSISDYSEHDFEILIFQNDTEFSSYAEEYAKQSLDLYGSLCDIKIIFVENKYGLLVKLHHIISDAWTMSLLAKQFAAILNGEMPEAYSYTEYLKSEKTYVASKHYQKDKQFFLEQFHKCDEITYLSDKQDMDYHADRKTFALTKGLTAQITALAERNHSSMFAVMVTLFGIYFSRIKMNVEKFYIGTPVLNRARIKEQNMMGMFINTVPLFMEIDSEKTFGENLQVTTNHIMSLLRHQHYNYEDLLSALRTESSLPTEKLYDVILSYQNAKTRTREFQTKWHPCGMQIENLQIHMDDRDDMGMLTINYDYRTDKFTEKEIERMHEHLSNLFADAIKDNNKKICELEILSDDEKSKLLYEFNDTKMDYPKDKCVHQLFEEQVLKTPNKTAVIACDQTLTYDELNKLANRMANALIEKGITGGDIVAFALPRTSYLIAVMFGILKSGAAYMPIDPDYPQDRIDYMLEDSKAKLFVTKDTARKLLDNKKTDNPNIYMSSEKLCYCIYTSGSTGLPKGVLIKHNNITNNIFWRCNQYQMHDNRVLSVTNVISDTFMEDMYYSLFSGNTFFVIYDNHNFNEINNALATDSSIMTTPTVFKSAMPFLKLDKFTDVILVGEALDKELVKKMMDFKISVHNEYGPSECTICSSYKTITDRITIGKPIANVQIYIVDKYMYPTPIGVTGELCIAGDGVGAGYLNRPELTAEKFIDNPFGEGKMYKTGDLAYWREDGNLVFVGRNDFQVKIRGLRIELGEIESAICSVDGISQAVVIVRKDKSGRQLICAFYTENSKVEIADIKKVVLNRLPQYMLPHIFHRIDKMSLTPSGKINRKALPEVDLENISNETEYVKPRTELQKEIAGLMEQVLNRSPVGLYDDFFDCGGDSLKAIEFVSKAHTDGIYFNMQAVFDHSTVQALCEYIEKGDKATVSYNDNDFCDIHQIISNNVISSTYAICKNELGNVFLTGATGYLGIHILAEFLESENGKIYCLVRGNDMEDSKDRLKGLLNFYFDGKYVSMLDTRIIVINGELLSDDFGLDKIQYDSIADDVHTIIHAAASVKHYGSYKYFYDINVEGTRRVIYFTRQANANLIHVSTLSVSGNSLGDNFDTYRSANEKLFGENSLFIGQELDNVYIRSKFEAEKMVIEAMAGGLHINICRMGNLTNRYSDGKFQYNYESNAFVRRVKALLELGAFPDYLLPLYAEFTPVDDAARAVMVIARHFNMNYNVFHVNNHKVVYFDKLLKCFENIGIDMEVVSDKDFSRRLRNMAEQSGREYIFETFINDMTEEEHLNYDSNIRILNDFTVDYLKALGFEWSDIGMDYVEKYINYFKKIGYIFSNGNKQI